MEDIEDKHGLSESEIVYAIDNYVIMDNELQALRSEIKELRSENSSLRDKIEYYRSGEKALRLDNISLGKDLFALDQIVRELEKKGEEYGNTIRQLNMYNDFLQDACQDFQNKKDTARSNLKPKEKYENPFEDANELQELKNAALRGCILEDLADAYNVHPATFNRWIRELGYKNWREFRKVYRGDKFRKK